MCSKKGRAVQTVSEQVVHEESVNETIEYPLHAVTTKTGTTPNTTEVIVNEKVVRMEVDTAAAVTVVSEATYNFKRLWPGRMLRSTTVKLKTYSGSSLAVPGQLQVHVSQVPRASSQLTHPSDCRRWPQLARS